MSPTVAGACRVRSRRVTLMQGACRDSAGSRHRGHVIDAKAYRATTAVHVNVCTQCEPERALIARLGRCGLEVPTWEVWRFTHVTINAQHARRLSRSPA